METHAKVVIIGGGVVGCSILFHLAKFGLKDCILLERKELTSGSSWHAAGNVHVISSDPNISRLMAYTIRLYKEIEETSGHSTGFKPSGGFYLASNEVWADYLKRERSKARYMGLDQEFISLEEVAKKNPLIDPKRYISALWDPIDGEVDPSGVTYAFAKAAKVHGAKYYNNTVVKDTKQKKDGTWDIISDQGIINKFIPGGKSGSSKPIILGLILLIVIWVFSGLYRVLPDEQGVVLRFGKFVSTTQPGLNYHLPYPVETVLTPKVTKVHRVDIGFRAASDTGRTSEVGDVPEESLMLTGDENIVNIDFSVFWVIKDAGKFLFKIQSPVVTVKATAETAMREVIARSRLQPILTKGRSLIEIETQEIMQGLLDEYESGIQITQVQTQKADPPDEVIDAFRDVQAARADMERSKNEAEGYQNDVIPRARGDAAKILQEAEAYKKKVIAMAEGEASRFLAIYNEYAKAKRVTQERMYLETMEKVLADIDKVIIDKNAGGVVPYLPLPALTMKSKGTDTQ